MEKQSDKWAEMMTRFLKDHEIFVCERVCCPVCDDELFVIQVKGRQMPGQPMGCLRVPSHGGC